ncbi:hypothetical protein HPT25_12225 [Bacillus sp. BRMEA1]|nr:hypothetical protein [Neobacillus endophyticus]NRD78154.1 hypothetical protein [Neobacillus endophyticus]
MLHKHEVFQMVKWQQEQLERKATNDWTMMKKGKKLFLKGLNWYVISYLI